MLRPESLHCSSLYNCTQREEFVKMFDSKVYTMRHKSLNVYKQRNWLNEPNNHREPSGWRELKSLKNGLDFSRNKSWAILGQRPAFSISFRHHCHSIRQYNILDVKKRVGRFLLVMKATMAKGVTCWTYELFVVRKRKNKSSNFSSS